MRTSIATSSFVSSIVVALGASARGDVLRVDDSGGAGVDYTSIQSAVDAAIPGDTVLVQSGSYAGFVIDAKSLIVTADLGAEVTVQGAVSIRNLGRNDAVLVRGVDAQANQFTFLGALSIAESLGSIWIEDSSFVGTPFPLKFGFLDAARVTNASAVTINRCAFQGTTASAIGVGAGAGMRLVNSTTFLFDSSVRGGEGEPTGAGPPIASGVGLSLNGGRLYASGSKLVGGNGAEGADVFECYDGGAGGAGLVLLGALPEAVLLDTETVGGFGGMAPSANCSDGPDGPGVFIESGSVQEQLFDARSLSAPSPVRAGETLQMSFEGLAGDAVFLWFSFAQDPTIVLPTGVGLFPLLGGPFLPQAQGALVQFMGTIGATSLEVATDVQETSLPAFTVYAQAAVVSPSAIGEIVFSSGQAITILPAAGG